MTADDVYERIKKDITEFPVFRFDWFCKSRYPQELQRWCNTLLGMIEEAEVKQQEEIKAKGGAGGKVGFVWLTCQYITNVISRSETSTISRIRTPHCLRLRVLPPPPRRNRRTRSRLRTRKKGRVGRRTRRAETGKTAGNRRPSSSGAIGHRRTIPASRDALQSIWIGCRAIDLAASPVCPRAKHHIRPRTQSPPGTDRTSHCSHSASTTAITQTRIILASQSRSNGCPYKRNGHRSVNDSFTRERWEKNVKAVEMNLGTTAARFESELASLALP